MRLQRYKLFFWGSLAFLAVMGVLRFLPGTVFKAPSPLVINELLTANRTGLTDADGDYSDWVEIYNRSSQPVNLSGWFLTDDPARPQKWAFPDVTLGAREYLLVFASGKERATGTELHTSFKLNRDSGFWPCTACWTNSLSP
jgi:hypothetical protein